MQAVIMKQPGDADVLQLADVPSPRIQADHDVLVRVVAAGINPLDTKLRARGTYYPERTPTILGCDGAGVVESVGAGVTRVRPGDEVYFFNGGIGIDQGNYAEYTVVHEDIVARKPKSLDFVHAAAVPLALITAWEALADRTRADAGSSVLVHGGAGGVGHFAIQLAKYVGATVCTTVGDDAKTQFVRSLGADCVINYRQQDFVTAVNQWSGGDGVDIALDTVGGETLSRTVGCVRQYGDLVTLLQPPADMDWKEARLRNLRITQELMLTPQYRRLWRWCKHQITILERAAELFDSGHLRVHVGAVLPLAQAAQAHRLIEVGGITGKLVLNCEHTT